MQCFSSYTLSLDFVYPRSEGFSILKCLSFRSPVGGGSEPLPWRLATSARSRSVVQTKARQIMATL